MQPNLRMYWLRRAVIQDLMCPELDHGAGDKRGYDGIAWLQCDHYLNLQYTSCHHGGVILPRMLADLMHETFGSICR